MSLSVFHDLMLPGLLAGVDEVGRGPLAGPVYAAAVIIAPDRIPAALTDSKKLSARQREKLDQQIRERATAWSVACASAAEIDQLNILRASHLAMERAVAGLTIDPELLLVDGNLLPKFSVPALAIVKGDSACRRDQCRVGVGKSCKRSGNDQTCAAISRLWI